MAELSRQTQSISWTAPADVMKVAAGLGMEGYLRAVAQGELPNSPAIEVMGIRLERFESGSAEVSFRPCAYHVNFVGAVHGGIISAVLDSCIGYAVNTTLKPNEAFVTTQLGIQYVRGIRPGGKIFTAKARLCHRGSRVVFAEAALTDDQDVLHALATATCTITERTAG
jgi:uncharacterized protein (TIGR00369 family)